MSIGAPITAIDLGCSFPGITNPAESTAPQRNRDSLERGFRQPMTLLIIRRNHFGDPAVLLASVASRSRAERLMTASCP
jgi:hypothetical protein